MWRSVEETARQLPGNDGQSWKSLMGSLVPGAAGLFGDLLGPLPLLPKHPLNLVGFGLSAMRSAT